MLIEFYLYKELFKSWGWSAEILEASELHSDEEFHMVYNRTTDFYLTEDRHKNLRQLWNEQKVAVSPQPVEYDLLANKNRLLELQKEKKSLPDEIAKILLDSFELKDFSSFEELWVQRKKYFFKPKTSFGGKSAYKGKSLSHKVFDRVTQNDPMIQEYFPPEKLEDWKFDVRCFAYKGEVQMISARLYQGQLTNFSTLFGGFCPVRLKS